MNRERGRLALLGLMLVAVWLGLAWRLAYVHVIRRRFYTAKADSLHWIRLSVEGERGRILDRFGRPLALSRLECSIRILPQYARDKDSLAALLASFGLGTVEDNSRLLQSHDRHFWFRRHVDYEIGDSLRRELVRHRFDNCVVVDDDYRRVYPFGEACAALVGCANDEQGLSGIEAEFDSVLAGRSGWVLLHRAATGRRFPYPNAPQGRSLRGGDIELTVDIEVQQASYHAIREGVVRTHAAKGAVVVLDAQSGELLAMADYPSFDPERYWEFPRERYKPTAACDNIEPGSSFKLAICAAALEERQGAGLAEKFYDVSAKFLLVDGHKIHDTHNNGVLTFDSIFIQSSNMACALLSFKVRPSLFFQVARDMGFSAPTGIGVPGEGAGFLDPPERLNRLRFANVAFGQGLTTTLLQLAAAYMCVANNGTYLKPYMVKSVRREERDVVFGRRTEVRQAISRQTAKRMQDIFARAVDHGTGTRARIAGVEVCGKTGTAQKCLPGGGYSMTASRMSFIGFFPRQNPRYVVAVLLDEPKAERFASTSACPVFSDVGTQLLDLERMRVSAQRTSVNSELALGFR